MNESAAEGHPPLPLRIWPAWLILAVYLVSLVLTYTPEIHNFTRFAYMMLGPMVCALLWLFWLVGFSRLPFRERWLYPAGLLGLGLAGALVGDSSIGLALILYGLPSGFLLLMLVLSLGRSGSPAFRIPTATVLLLAAWTVLMLLRLDGFDGTYLPEFAWRWTPTAEEQLLAGQTPETEVELPEDWQPQEIPWPSFRGPEGNSQATGPAEWQWPEAPLWEIEIGPAWSSFAVVGNRLFTQEQRGEEEWVSCYDANTGSLIWKHADQTRFFDLVSGAGPRATPTYHEGRLYTLGGKGMLNCLDAATGQPLWQHDLMEEFEATLPEWGFSSSPVVTQGVVIVYGNRLDGNGLMAFDLNSGEVAWTAKAAGMNFSSAEKVTLADQEHIVFGDSDGLVGIDPAEGTVLWRYKPTDWEGPAITQPQQIAANSLIVPLGDGVGVARLNFEYLDNEWKITEAWSNNRLKSSYNDFVYHDGHLYGFDKNIFASLDAETGQRNWKRGRYQFGQVLLIENLNQLLVTSEFGEVILLAANPESHEELSRKQLLDDKTWNHPVLVGNRLYLRNGRQASCWVVGPEPAKKSAE